ncbi:hypothetical protein H8356DRAFT_1318069 [Neocallimastix lanati (nom. inval.)]|jgi:hypothetical protein|uniref:Uncharacterized protein n=1 Tax=Neocallimastix californiae TaxID=1754190 RepID=A0A1Y2DAP0_9FUNG|nr:hypothetical protein H8356DRAFT_1318069 [Neocallimastix sp. JGI-2020a]ORY56224.1 hypothetical protein LY90DRAFT_669407 [Neocallimastix californiae]|eukprot:ORY56224.1 hypothetical protein LY90DRAFT_669407 [Neocallimastix californiae]
MAKTSLFQKFIYVVLICTLLIKVVSAFDDENALDEHINDPEIDTDNKEDDIEDMKMPHIDAKKERPIEKVDIPKIIHQYVRSKDSISIHTQNNINSWKSLNTDWEHKLYDYDDIKAFMETHHAKVIDLWNVLDFNEKINMWKYAVLETYGGVYADANCFCVKPINQWIRAYDKSNILIGLDHLYIPKEILNEKKLTDSIQFDIHTIVSAPGHEILANMPFYIHRYRVLGTLNVVENDPDYRKYGRAFFSSGAALFTESCFNYLIENNVVLENIEDGGLVRDVAVLSKNAFAYKASNLSDLPDDVLSVYFPEKTKLKEKNDYII